MGITIMEIVLLAVSAAVFAVSFLIPDKKVEDQGIDKEFAQSQVKDLVKQEMEQIRGHVDEVTQETVNYAMEKTERSLERISNEKMMALGEYSDTVIQEIHRNHEEVVFLYDMLNAKQDSLKKTVAEAGKAAKAMQDSVASFQSLKAPSENTGKMVTEVSQEEKASLTEMPKMAAPAFRQIPQGTRKVRREDLAVEEEPETIVEPEGIRTSPESDRGEGITDIVISDDSGRNKNERILELHDQGKSNVAIAKELGLGVGEVKLVIDLYKNL